MSIHRLRNLRQRLPSLGDDGEWLARCIEIYEERAREGQKLDAICGLIPGRGQSPWWEVENLRRRQDLIDSLSKHYRAPRISQLADEISRSLSRYRGGRWRFEKDRDEVSGNETHKLMHSILQLSDGNSLGKDSIKRALQKKA